MNELIYKQAAKDAVDMALDTIDHVPEWVYDILLNSLDKLPSAQPETQKLLDDGTLIVHTDIDITKITRVNITQNNTHYGDLFYRDEE